VPGEEPRALGRFRPFLAVVWVLGGFGGGSSLDSTGGPAEFIASDANAAKAFDHVGVRKTSQKPRHLELNSNSKQAPISAGLFSISHKVVLNATGLLGGFLNPNG
jgi:hypothetical protein